MLPSEVFDLTVPDERRATCMDCPKARTAGFLPDYRCCTYHPRVPNFLLGLAGREERPRKIMQKLLESGYLLPEGMHPSAQLWAAYIVDLAEDQFGKSKSVLCPFLERSTGFCQIYPFRNSVCSTFFCIHDHGSKGDNFWTSLQTLVQQVEMALGQWALREIGFDMDACIKRFNKIAPEIEKTSKPDGAWRKQYVDYIWGNFSGRELEVYSQCADLVSQNRTNLWEIANKTVILEPNKFDRAAHRLVPRRHRHEIDPEDFATGENALPKDLLKDLRRSYRNLWNLPPADKNMHLSPRVEVQRNDSKDAESKYFSQSEWVVVIFETAAHREVEDRIFVNAVDAELLMTFTKPKRLTRAYLNKVSKVLAPTTPQKFFGEWIGKKVLVPARAA